MDCQNFKELLDSYLCGELAVETNHTMLAHAERCCSCRSEMSARRQLRASLRRVCSREKMSEQALENLRARLRSEVGLGANPARTGESGDGTGRRSWIGGILKIRILTPAAIVAALALLVGGAWGLYLLRSGDVKNHQGKSQLSSEQLKSLELSDAILAEAVGDHRSCAPYFVNASKPVAMPDSVREYDSACVRLDKIAATGAKGLFLRSAHTCGFGDRKFVHLVYTHDTQLISLLVTSRDGRALKSGVVPTIDGAALGAQRSTHDHIALGAYQTVKRIVFVVSDLPESENAALAEKLAKPVVEHLRNSELSTARSRLPTWRFAQED